MTVNPTTIDDQLVRRLLTAQFPHWAALPIAPAVPQGWDNRTFRLGTELSVRLPSAHRYVLQVEKEHRWLPYLAPRLPLPIPAPLAQGAPGEGYPWPWSVYRWIDGQPALLGEIGDLTQFAADVAHFLAALHTVDATGGPEPGSHNFWRGAPPAVYDTETRHALAALDGLVDTDAVRTVWDAALRSHWHHAPVWIHGDIAPGNLLLRDGQLNAVIDFGGAAVGDPACDTVIAWTLFEGQSRAIFRTMLPLDEATWMRGRGWALWKALITLAGHLDPDVAQAAQARRTIDAVLADAVNGG